MGFGERFLVYPDLFPARATGVPWGDRQLDLAFVGGPYRVSGLADWQAEWVRARFGALVRDAGAGERTVPWQVLRAPAEDFLDREPGPWEYTFDLDHEPAAVRIAALRFVGRLDWRPSLAGTVWTSVGEDEFPGVFENFFRVIAAHAIAEHGGLLLHSAAVETDGAALVFFGPSGAGKTTVSRLGQRLGRRVLSDDLNAIAPADDGYRVEKVPFAGDLGGAPEAVPALPLAAVCRLRKGTTVQARAMTEAGALAALIAASPFLNVDPERGKLLESRLLELVGAVPVVELTFGVESPFEEVEAAVSSVVRRVSG